MRTAFINQLIEEAKVNTNIFLLVGDLGYSVVETFQQLFPDRFLNVGIAEQNMTSVAAGLAMEGYNVFTYSIGNFPTLRALEQIRYDVCYHNLSVKIVSVGAGFAYGPLGASHHTTEDIGIMRTLPNMIICSPADPLEAKEFTSFLCNSSNPGYLRLGKSGEESIHCLNQKIDPFKMIFVKEGLSTVVLATGSIIADAKKHIEEFDLSWGLVSVPLIKPLDLNTLSFLAMRYDNIITLEEHQRSAGFGSAILEGLSDLLEYKRILAMPNFKRIAIPDLFWSKAGTQDYIRSELMLKLG